MSGRMLVLVGLLLAVAGCRDRSEAPAGSRPSSAEATGRSVLPEGIALAGDSAPRNVGGLDAIRERGELRVLVTGSEEDYLPRQGTPSFRDRGLAREFAERHSLGVRFVLVSSLDSLIGALLEGQGDVIAAQLTVTEARAKQVAFTTPVATVRELLVGKRGTPDLPRAPEALAGREVHVAQTSSFAASLDALKVPDVRVVFTPPELTFEALAYEVSIGRRPLTVIDENLARALAGYNPDVETLFPIAEGSKIAWAVRKENPALKAALDAFLSEKALTGHTDALFTGDLAGIRERGVLRVITRNNPVTYFLYRGEQLGFDFELSRMLAAQLGVRLEMVVPPSRDLLIPWLLEGRGDLIAASMTITPDRAEQVSFSEPYLRIDEMLVQSKRGPRVAGLEDLAGQEVHVRPSSSYAQSLRALDVEVKIVEVDESVETEELIGRVAAGEIPFTVADRHILDAELTWRADVEAAFPLARAPEGSEGSKEIAFALRPDSRELREQVDLFVGRVYRGLEYNMARKRYFQNRKRIVRIKESRSGRTGGLSPYDDLIKKYSSQYGFDWRLMAALAYQESRFDPKARSWVGAEGLFQVMPETGRSLGFDDLTDPEQGIHAGIKYLRRMVDRLDPKMPYRQRVRMAMASYNAGLGHVLDARRLAEAEGLDPNRWFQNVEKAMLMLERPRYYRRARHGYVRGSEPVKYVSEIQNRYDNYVTVVTK